MTSVTIPAAFHTQSEANRLSLERLWPAGFFLSSSTQNPTSSNAYHALAKVVLANGFVIGAEITQEGAGYVEVPAVTITGGGGSGAVAVAVLTSGRVTSIEIINAGKGYASEPTVTIDPPPITSPQVSLRLVPAVTVTGEFGQSVIIEVADTADGPWSEWRSVVIGEDGTTEVDLDEGAEKRFYRVRN
ncbi:MAG: hypothetical protein ACFHW5_18450 [Verrucomicrobiota bacterium]